MFKEFLRDFWAYSKLLSALIGVGAAVCAGIFFAEAALGRWHDGAQAGFMLPIFLYGGWLSRGASA